MKMIFMGSNVLTIWDSSNQPFSEEGIVYTWNSYIETMKVSSILKYAELHGQRIRQKYMDWLFEMGKININGRSLIDRLTFKEGFSYWWMTLLSEKNSWNSQAISDGIRMFALEEMIMQYEPASIRLVSANFNLHKTIKGLCQELNISYKWQKINEKKKWNLRNMYLKIPLVFQALASLARYLYNRWPLRKVKSAFITDTQSIFFTSYFFNLDLHNLQQGKYRSRYWEGLDQLMDEMAVKANWLHIYHPHDAVPNATVAVTKIDQFARELPKNNSHRFVDSHLSVKVVYRILKQYVRIIYASYKMGNIDYIFKPSSSHFSLWPLMKKDWRVSIKGQVAISNLLFCELFDIALKNTPYQQLGLFLYENQPWERAFIYAWRKHKHGKLIAVAHATIRFWDLRYYSDSRISDTSYHMPQPDAFALNGQAAIRNYMSARFPVDSIVLTEALRFGYMNNIRINQSKTERSNNACHILILGDYLSSSTNKILELLQLALPFLPEKIKFTLKPHPNCSIAKEEYPLLRLNIELNPLEKIMHDFDIAYSSNSTSASVDAYLAGLPVIVCLEDGQLNFSPLRGMEGVVFISTPQQLINVLHSINKLRVTRDIDDFFYLNPELPRWRKLLDAVLLN